MVSSGPRSTISPAYITAQRLQSWATTGRSWVTRMSARPKSRQSPSSSSRIWACTITSSAIVELQRLDDLMTDRAHRVQSVHRPLEDDRDVHPAVRPHRLLATGEDVD